MTFRTVFDAGQMGYSTGWFPAIGLFFVCLGALLVFKPVLMLKLLPHGLQGRARTAFSWFCFLFSIFWTVTALSITYVKYRTAVDALESGQYSVVEGPVTDFVPMPREGHALESFSVGGTRFSYSDFTVTPGFHNSASHGGPIREGLYIRIAHVGNLILRLEVAE